MQSRKLIPLAICAVLLLVGLVGHSMPLPQSHSSSAKTHEPVQSPATNGTVHEVRGLKVDGDYELYGAQYDNVSLIGASIGGALKIDGVRNVTISDSHLHSIWFRDRFPTQTVVIRHNDISMAPGDCIHLFDGATSPLDVRIVNNRIHDCGIAFPASDLYHAIYDQVPGVVIRGNCISNARSAISIRSSATIDNNLIQSIPSGGGIEYFSDHNAEPGGQLVIAGNTIVSTLQSQPGAGSLNRGLVVLGNDIGKGTRPVSDYWIHDNTVVLLNRTEQQGNGRSFDVYEQGDHPNARFANNTFINLIPESRYIGPYGGGQEVSDLKTHDPREISKIVTTKPGCQ